MSTRSVYDNRPRTIEEFVIVQSLDADATVAAIVDDVAARGYAVARGFVSVNDAGALRAQALLHDRAGALSPGAIGHGASRVAGAAIRGDRTRWIDAASTAVPVERRLIAALDALRVSLNRELHARVLSLVLYLNADWRVEEGGALRLATGERGDVQVAPEGGVLVTFLSDRFPHEVQPAARERVSIAGWFRRRA